MATSPVDVFPDDNVNRVVWGIGAIYARYKGSVASSTEVALRKALSDGTLSEKADVYKTFVSQLGIVRQGTVWAWEYKASRIWKSFHNYSIGQKFSFSFQQNESYSVEFCEKEPGQYSVLIPFSVYLLKSITNKAAEYYHFYHSHLICLRTVNLVNVSASSMEFYTSTYTLFEQKIRNDLLVLLIDDVLVKYMDLGNSWMNEKGEYDMIYFSKGVI